MASSENDAGLWHRRLGHMSATGMKVMVCKEKLDGVTYVDLQFCEDCVLEIKRSAFLRENEILSKKLELVHTDIWEPFQVPSVNGSQYYVTLLMTVLECFRFIS